MYPVRSLSSCQRELRRFPALGIVLSLKVVLAWSLEFHCVCTQIDIQPKTQGTPRRFLELSPCSSLPQVLFPQIPAIWPSSSLVSIQSARLPDWVFLLCWHYSLQIKSSQHPGQWQGSLRVVCLRDHTLSYVFKLFFCTLTSFLVFLCGKVFPDYLILLYLEAMFKSRVWLQNPCPQPLHYSAVTETSRCQVTKGGAPPVGHVATGTGWQGGSSL